MRLVGAECQMQTKAMRRRIRIWIYDVTLSDGGGEAVVVLPSLDGSWDESVDGDIFLISSLASHPIVRACVTVRFRCWHHSTSFNVGWAWKGEGERACRRTGKDGAFAETANDSSYRWNVPVPIGLGLVM